MNKASDVSTISVNRHEKMGAFKSRTLWQQTTTEACGEKRTLLFPLLHTLITSSNLSF